MANAFLCRIGRYVACQVAVFGIVLAVPADVTAAPREPMVFHGASSGSQTLDQGEGGGNPFASAVIDLLAKPTVALTDLPDAVRQLTYQKSRGFQVADVPTIDGADAWQLKPKAADERRIALVLIVSDYSRSGGAPSLPGALHDGERIAAALRNAGFETRLEPDLDAAGMRRSLERFSAETRNADAAVVYTTGHGVEVGGTIYLIPGNYPIAEKNAALATRAVPLREVGQSLRARHVNLLFYGGCRDNPFGN